VVRKQVRKKTRATIGTQAGFFMGNDALRHGESGARSSRLRYHQGYLVKAINVEDLPEPVARALDTVVQTLRSQLVKKRAEPSRKIDLPRWPGTVIGSLRRADIYARAG